MKKVLYLGWIGFKNLGDELLWELFKHHFEQAYDAAEAELVPSVPGVQLKDMSEYDTVVLGGGSLLLPGYIDLAYQAYTAGKKVCVWGTGFDCMHSPYTISSGWLEPAAASKLKELMEESVYFGIRGPLTQKVLQASGVPVAPELISGDPAVLLSQPKHPAGSLPGKIAINWGTTYNKLFGRNEPRVEDEVVSAAKGWIEQGWSIYLYPVWGPDRAPIQRLAEKIGDASKVEVEQELLGTEPLIERLTSCHFSVNFKLHANLLSYAADVPFIALGYRFKCFDFGESAGLGHYVISTGESDLAERLQKKADFLLEYRDDYIQKIRNHREQFSPRLTIPFDQKLLI